MLILAQFLYRLSFGLAGSMALLSPRQVSSGYFRVHSYVILGALAVLLAVGMVRPDAGLHWGWPAVGLLVSYVTGALWLYELPVAGRVGLVLMAAHSLVGIAGTLPLANQPVVPAVAGTSAGTEEAPRQRPELSPSRKALLLAEGALGGALFGALLAGMLLGHWYLNSPGMKLAPLRYLVWLLGGLSVLRGLFLALCLWVGVSGGIVHPGGASEPVWFLLLRWVSGILGPFLTAIFTLATLRIPNTQSATGILYAGVVVVLMGELMGLLLAFQTAWPL